MQHQMTYLEPSQAFWRGLPEPWTCTDVESPSNPINILCPFNVLSRIRNLVGDYVAGKCIHYLYCVARAYVQ